MRTSHSLIVRRLLGFSTKTQRHLTGESPVRAPIPVAVVAAGNVISVVTMVLRENIACSVSGYAKTIVSSFVK